VDIDAQAVTPGEWQCGVRRLAVANGRNIFQMLLVLATGEDQFYQLLKQQQKLHKALRKVLTSFQQTLGERVVNIYVK